MKQIFTDEELNKELKIVTGCCHFNENGACLDHKGGRDISNFCSEAHAQAEKAYYDKAKRRNERFTGAD